MTHEDPWTEFDGRLRELTSAGKRVVLFLDEFQVLVEKYRLDLSFSKLPSTQQHDINLLLIVATLRPRQLRQRPRRFGTRTHLPHSALLGPARGAGGAGLGYDTRPAKPGSPCRRDRGMDLSALPRPSVPDGPLRDDLAARDPRQTLCPPETGPVPASSTDHVPAPDRLGRGVEEPRRRTPVLDAQLIPDAVPTQRPVRAHPGHPRLGPVHGGGDGRGSHPSASRRCPLLGISDAAQYSGMPEETPASQRQMDEFDAIWKGVSPRLARFVLTRMGGPDSPRWADPQVVRSDLRKSCQRRANGQHLIFGTLFGELLQIMRRMGGHEADLLDNLKAIDDAKVPKLRNATSHSHLAHPLQLELEQAMRHFTA